MSEVVDISELRIGKRRLKNSNLTKKEGKWVRVMEFIGSSNGFVSVSTRMYTAEFGFDALINFIVPDTSTQYIESVKFILINGLKVTNVDIKARFVYKTGFFTRTNPSYLEIYISKSNFNSLIYVESDFYERATPVLEEGSIPDGYLAKEFVLIKKTEDESGGG